MNWQRCWPIRPSISPPRRRTALSTRTRSRIQSRRRRSRWAGSRSATSLIRAGSRGSANRAATSSTRWECARSRSRSGPAATCRSLRTGSGWRSSGASGPRGATRARIGADAGPRGADARSRFPRSALPQHPFEDSGDVPELVVEVECLVEFLGVEARLHLRLGGERVLEVAPLVPDAHRVALHDDVGGLPLHAALDELEEHRLGEDEAARRVQVLQDALGVDAQALDQAGKAVEHEVEGDGGVGANHPLDARVADVALVPEGHVLERAHGVAAEQAGESGQVLAQDRVALVRHRARALLAFPERLLRLAHLRALQVTDLGGELLERRAGERQRREVFGVPVAVDDLRGDRLRGGAKPLYRCLLD